MKKKIIIMAIALGLGFSSFGQGSGLFKRGYEDEERYGAFRYDGFMHKGWGGELPALPYQHDLETDQPAPVGGGVVLLIGFGAVYALSKKREFISES